MSDLDKVLWSVVGVAALIGVAAAVRAEGFAAVGRRARDVLRSFRAVEVAGTGIRLIGVRPLDTDRSTATLWLTLLYLPVAPLARSVVRFVDPGVAAARWIVLERTVLDRREVGRTYLFGWILYPALVLAPFLVLWGERWLDERTGLHAALRRLVGGRDAWTILSAPFLLAGLVLAVGGVVWLVVVGVRLYRWDEKRRRPPGAR